MILCLVVIPGTWPVRSNDAVVGEDDSDTARNETLEFLTFIVGAALQQRLPGAWSLTDSMILAPGIVEGMRYASDIGSSTSEEHIHGAAANDNLYWVDGLDHTDILFADGTLAITPEVLDVLEIRTGALPAEYGRAMGGVYEARTRSGTNTWHGSLRLDYVNTDWNEDVPENPYYPDDLHTGDDYDYLMPTFTVDGPLLEDRLWFLAAYGFYNYTIPQRSLGFWGADYTYSGDGTPADRSPAYHHPFLKISWAPSHRQRFDLSWYGVMYSVENASGDPQTDTPEAWLDEERGYTAVNLDWHSNLSPALTFGGKIGYIQEAEDILPKKQSNGPRDAPFRDTYYGQSYNNGSEWIEDDRERFQLSVIAHYAVDDLMGGHEWQAGIEYQDMKREYFQRYPGRASYVTGPEPIGGDPANGFTGNDATRTVFINTGTTEETGRYLAAYIRDDWAVSDTVTLNLGLRYEWAEYANNDGDTDVPAWRWGNFAAETYLKPDGSVRDRAPMRFDDMLAPRISVDWDIFGDGSTMVHGFMGRAYNPFDLSLPGMFQPFSADQNAERDQEYTGPEWRDMDRDGLPDEDFFFDESNWETIDEDMPGNQNLIDPDLKAEYTDELSVGLQQRVRGWLDVGLTAIYRRTDNMIEDAGLFVDDDGNIVWTWKGAVNDDFTGLKPGWDFDPRDTGQDYTDHVYYITNVDGNDREYRGLELSVLSRGDCWDVRLFYTLSEAEGAVIEAQEDYPGIAQFSGQFDTPGTSENLYGTLPWSTRHHIRCAGSAWVDVTDWYEMSFGVNAYWMSGYHYSRKTNPPFTYDPDDPFNDINDPSTWTGRPPYRSYHWHFVEPRGGYELPDVYNVDVSWHHRFRLGNAGSVVLTLDIQNVTNSQQYITYDSWFFTYYPREFSNPREYRLSLKYAI